MDLRDGSGLRFRIQETVKGSLNQFDSALARGDRTLFMRLFCALDIPADALSRLQTVLQPLRTQAPLARWTGPLDTHVTLKFIGEFPETRLPEIPPLLRRIQAEPFLVRTGQLAITPSGRQARVLWLEVETSPALAELAARIERQLEAVGIPAESRDFRPHITLARSNQMGLLRTLPLAGPEPLCWTAGAYHLYESKLSPKGAHYRRLQTFPL